MKTWIDKFKTSLAFDRGDKPNPTDKLRRFDESLRAMDRDLRATRTNPTAPANLHAGIMRAIRQSRPAQGPAMPSTLFWRLAGTAALVAAGATLFWMTSQSPYKVAEAPPPTETSLSFAVVFDQSHALTQAAPKVMLEPLSGEMELLDHDFRAAVTFLADSMP